MKFVFRKIFILKVLFFLMSFIFVSTSAAERTVSLGHNLAMTTEIPEKGTWSLGSYLLGYSFNDSFFMGTSAWMAWNYNSYSVFGRWRLGLNTDYYEHLNLQFSYIQSDKSLGHFYEQKIGLLWLTTKHSLNEVYRLYTTINYMYFWDETLPFSLRREPFNNQPDQWSLTTLHQIEIRSRWGMNFEVGVLGLTYRTPLMHTGLSFYKLWESFLMQIGVSYSATTNNFLRLYDNSSQKSSGAYLGTQKYDFSMHPEIQLQYNF